MAPVRERRNEDERRQREAGPPRGWKDRRHSTERRQIAVAEVSYEEWMEISNTFAVVPSSPDAFDNPADL